MTQLLDNIEQTECALDTDIDEKKYSMSDVRLRRSEATKLFFKRWKTVDIQQWLVETYGVSLRTAQKDTAWIKDDISRKCEKKERVWLNRKTDSLLARMEEYEALAKIGEDEKANAALLKQRDLLEKELDAYTIPNVLAKAKEAGKEDPKEFLKGFIEAITYPTEDSIVRDDEVE